MENSKSICGVPSRSLRDCRYDAAGYDFGLKNAPDVAIEVKGLKTLTGAVLFTDLEWRTARTRAESYWLVVVGELGKTPRARMWRNPVNLLEVKSSLRRATTVSWHATVSVA